MIQKPKTEYIKNPIFVSFTSLSDFLKCPRTYFLKNIYKQSLPPQAGVKTHEPFRIQIASPYLSLGSTVHDAVKWFIDMKGQVTKKQYEEKFRNFWFKYTGKRGGFSTRDEEANFGNRGLKMLDNFWNNWKVLERPAPAISFPKLHLFDRVVLMGNFDFLGEKEDQTLHVVDFKTGANDEKDPLQLYIYAILAEANLEKKVSSASFWYLDRDDKPKEIVLDPLEPKLEWLKDKGKQLKQAIAAGEWICVRNDALNGALCRDCKDYQAIVEGKGEFQFTDYRYKKGVYYLAY